MLQVSEVRSGNSGRRLLQIYVWNAEDGQKIRGTGIFEGLEKEREE